MREGESTRRAEGRGDSIVGGDRPKVAIMEIVELTNEKVNVVRGEGIVLVEVVESDEGKSGWKVPPKNMNGRTGVLGRANNMHHRGVKGEGGGNVNLNYNQRVVMDLRPPLKVMECTDKKGGSGETGV